MIRHYELTDDDLFTLARFPARPSALELLRSAQISKRMLLIRHLRDGYAHHAWDDALAVFERAQTSPAAACVLSDPWTGAWAAQCARQLNTGRLARAEMLHFNALAAATALKGGLDADLTLPVRDGIVFLPRLGTLRVGGGRDTHRLRVRSGRAGSIPGEPEVDTPTWSSHRQLRTTIGSQTARVILDDLSPYRNVFRLPLTGRLGADAVAEWQGLWARAWELLADRVPQRVGELLRCLDTAVPLARAAGRAGFSATSRDAFAAFALRHPAHAVNLAVTLVHEAQHAKLGALLDLVPLHTRPSNVYFAPWRDDPRPIGGLLHGTFAFLAIAETWWRLASDPRLERAALPQFAHMREQVAMAAAALEQAPELTAHGRVFVAGLRAALDRLLLIDLPSELVKQARTNVNRMFDTWRRANAGVA